MEEEFTIDSMLKSDEKNRKIEEIFDNLPLPYVLEEFKIDSSLKASGNPELQMPPYVRVRRNVYLVKKKRDTAYVDNGCSACSSTCEEDCVCRVQCISCSRNCRCAESCTNRPFSKGKQIIVVKTELCGWGAEAAESINKGDFIIEYVGEVIDDALCERRLWDMKYKGVSNFYLCEIGKNFTIDATYKGNASRFLNHSCDPNCKLEKWQVEGEIRVGIFAARAIKVGEPLTYDYRFVQFGPEVKCHCGAVNCQGYLGMKRKNVLLNLSWGSKRKRSLSPCIDELRVK
ncbi:Histone-lysine N-methyltransferase ASHR3-like protein [Drosera capensis]